MEARLISYSQPTSIVGIDDVEELIAFSARVSNPSNQMNKYLQANYTNAEVDSTTDNPIDFLSNGMKMRYNNTATNQNNGTYIYMAFAEQPGLTPYDTQTNAR